MWHIWVQFAIISVGIIVYFLYTVVFCFWFIYLVDAMKRKRSFYKATLRCVEGESNPHEQMLAYNAKTQLVKFVSLFCLNLVEWLGFTSVATFYIVEFVRDYQQELLTNDLWTVSDESKTSLLITCFGIVCLVFSMAILGSLCMYLSARYAQKSWIKSNRIPYWICFFLFSSIASQILDTICYTYIIGMWCDIILVTVSVIFAWKQYRKLDMVLQWSIVDLRVNGDIELLDRHVRMKRRFNRIFTTIWIGVSFELVAFFIDNVFRTTHILLHSYNHLFIDISLYDDISHSHFDSFVFALVYWLEVSITLLGLLIFFVPYIGYGLCTMYVLLWRLFKGKTGYRTHFHVQLTDPLVLH